MQRQPIQVRSYGEGEPSVMLLHGGPGAPGSLAPLARLLSDQFSVGEAIQRKADGIALSVASHIADLHEVMKQPMDLVGHSWGAMLALSFASRHSNWCAQSR